MRKPPQGHMREVGKGIAVTFALHVVWLGFWWIRTGSPTSTLPFLWASEWLYILPGLPIAYWRKRPGIAQGLLLAGAATFLLDTVYCASGGMGL
jgi:hypothetical protein